LAVMNDSDTHSLIQCIANIATATMGPHGQHVMLRSMDSVSVTSSSRHYIEQTCVQYSHPHSHSAVVKILLQVLSTHHKTQGDAGWLCVYLAMSLLRSFKQQELPPSSFIAGINLACDLAVEELHSPTTPLAMSLDWGEPEQVLCVLKSMFHPHKSSTHLSEEQSSNLAATLLSAFIGSLSDGSSGSLSPHIVFHSSSLTLALPDQSCCQHLEGTLLMDIPLPHAFPEGGARNILVAVFEQSLEIPAQLANITIETNNKSAPANVVDGSRKAMTSVKELEYAYMEEMCDVLVRANVGLVCCQRRVHPHLQRLLSLKGIVCVPRLSIRYVNAVLRLSGAKQLGAFPQLQTLRKLAGTGQESLSLASLGFFHHINIRNVGSKQLIAIQQSQLYDQEQSQDGDVLEEVVDEDVVLRQLLKDKGGALAQQLVERRLKYSTVLLVGFTENHCREIETMCGGALKVLTQLVNGNSATVLPGGGCWQAYVSHAVRRSLVLRNDDHKGSGNDSIHFDYDDEFEFLPSVSHLRDTMKAANLFCDAVAGAARLIGVKNNTGHDTGWERFLHPDAITTANQFGSVGWGGFTWPDMTISTCQPPRGSPRVCRFVNPVGIEIVTETVQKGSADIETSIIRADVLDAIIPNVSALQVAVQAVSSIVNIDGIIR
jgi:chaperonin GroEL (HSP60 family)